MTKFKLGDVVQRIDPEGGAKGIKMGVDLVVTELVALTGLVFVRDSAGKRGGLYPHRLELVVEETLPPAPDSVMYQHCSNYAGKSPFNHTLTASWNPSYFDGPAVRIFIDTNDKGITLQPDDAIQLAHDIYRMARAAKKAQEV